MKALLEQPLGLTAGWLAFIMVLILGVPIYWPWVLSQASALFQFFQALRRQQRDAALPAPGAPEG